MGEPRETDMVTDEQEGSEHLSGLLAPSVVQ